MYKLKDFSDIDIDIDINKLDLELLKYYFEENTHLI